MKQKSKFKILTVLNIILLVFLFSGTSVFAYWAIGIKGAKKDVSKDVHIGKGDVVLTTIELNDPTSDNLLVPKGKIKDNGKDLDEITFVFNVHWKSDNDLKEDSPVTTLIVEASATEKLIIISGAGQYDITLDSSIQITITITLSEPKNKADYDRLMANNNIKLNITFTIADIQ